MVNKFDDLLLTHLTSFQTNPFLFVGSGISRRYYNLPTWEELLENFFLKSKIKGEYNYYYSKSNDDLPKLASIFAEEFHEIWWKDIAFQDTRNINAGLAKKSVQVPLKIELSTLITEGVVSDGKFRKEINLFRNSIVEGIITTNWDDFLEKTFSDYKVFARNISCYT